MEVNLDQRLPIYGDIGTKNSVNVRKNGVDFKSANGEDSKN